MNFCLCGCGVEVKNKFVKGHHIRLHNPMHDRETVEKVTAKLLGRPLTESHRKNIGDSQRGKSKPKFTQEHCDNLSKAKKGVPNPKITNSWRIGRPLSDMHRKNISLGQLRSRDLRVEIAKELWKDPDYASKTSKAIKDGLATPQAKINKSIASKNNWRNPEYAEKVIRGTLLGCLDLPNIPELIVGNILYENNYLGYLYSGDGLILVGYKNPDYIDINNKKIIEIYGDYWHKNEDPDKRIDYFKRFGYDCLVIWEHEIYDDLEKVVDRIKEFNDK